MDRTQKEAVVSQLQTKFQAATAVFVSHYRGLTVSEVTQIRQELRAVNGHLQVVKNRLMKRALSEEAADLANHLQGPVAITFANDDPVSVAKILAKFQKDLEPLVIKAGLMEGTVMEVAQVEALSKLPSKEELYAKLIGTLAASAVKLVRVLQANSEQLVRALAAVRDTKEAS